MKLYVDDLRKCPEGWTLARNNTEAIRLLATGYVTEVSVDHDICTPFSGEISAPVRRRLQIGQETFEPVVYYIIAMDVDSRPEKVTIHSANMPASIQMLGLLKAAGINATYLEGSYDIDLGENEI